MFSNDWKDCLDYSDEAMVELYNVETFGGNCSNNNGFSVGKKWLNVQVQMWRDDIRDGYLFISELYSVEKYPSWWLDRILKDSEDNFQVWKDIRDGKPS